MTEIKYLIFEGGGTKCIAYIGALRELNRMKKLDKLQGTCGSSGGALYALLLACEYTIDEIYDIMYELNFNDNMKSRLKSNYIFPIIRHCFEGYGHYTMDDIQTLINGYIEEKLGTEQATITFAELYDITDIELVITGTNISKMRTEYFSKNTTPDMSVSLATIISMSYPYVFNTIKYNGDYYVDGGMLNNYPMCAFDNDGNGIPKNDVYGLKLESKINTNEITNLFNYRYYFGISW